MSLIKSNSLSIKLLYNVNLITAKFVDGRLKDLVPSCAGTGFESPRQHPRSSLRRRYRTVCPESKVGMEWTWQCTCISFEEDRAGPRPDTRSSATRTSLSSPVVLHPVGVKHFYIYQIAHTRSLAHSASCSVDTVFLSRGKSGRDVKLTSHHHLISRLRISGAILLLPSYAFTGKILPFTCWVHESLLHHFSASDSDLEVEMKNINLCAMCIQALRQSGGITLYEW